MKDCCQEAVQRAFGEIIARQAELLVLVRGDDRPQEHIIRGMQAVFTALHKATTGERLCASCGSRRE